jgi:ketosteroid isomerase-like protein
VGGSVRVTRPEDMNPAFADAFNSGDVELLLALYEPDALLAPRPGERARGHAAIREALVQLLRLDGRMSSRNVYCMQADELALLRGEWTLGDVAARSSEVVRRQADGSWLYLIDHPFGDDAA